MASHNSSNTEFTRKLRAAVKAKLEEFGLDVDEELPDYVMIMVGNKKDKGRMKSELKLFLGDNTSPFVEWLFGFFQKVKTVTSSITEEMIKEKKPKTEPVENPSTTKTSHEKKKYLKEKAVKREEVPEPVKKEESHRSRKPRIEAPASPKAKSEVKERKKEGHRHISVEAIKPKKEKEREKHSHRKHKPSSERYEEYLTNSDEEEEEEIEMPVPKPKLKVKAESKHEKVEKPYRKSKKDSPKRERILTQALPKREEKKKEEKTLISTRQPVVLRTKASRRSELRPISYDEDSDVSEREPSPLPHKKNARPQVAAQSSNFDDSPPPKPKLSSKVVVMHRKPEKPIQPNSRVHSSIFKRAISDAASFSAGYGSKRTVPEEERDIQLDYEDKQPTMKKPRDKLSSYINYSQNEENGAAKNTRIIVTVKNSDKDNLHSGVTIKNEADIEEDEEEDGVDEQEIEEKDEEVDEPNTIPKEAIEDVVKGSEMQEEKSEEQVEEGRSDVEDNLADNEASKEDQQVIAAVMSHLKRKRRADDLTRAFLKLSGINPKVARLLQATEQQHQPKTTPNMPSNLCALTTESLKQPIASTKALIESVAAVKTEQKTEIVQTVQMTDFQDSLKSITRTIMNSAKNSADSSPNTPITPVWDGQINLDDFSSSDDEAEIDALLATAQAVRSANNTNETHEIIPPTAILSRPSLFRSGSTGNYATLGYNPTQYQPAYVPPVRAVLTNSKISERCRFWPDCRNEDICPFHHPTKPCANFPNCWFGDKCLYLHPKCRFGPSCSKPKCQFMHTKAPVVVPNNNSAGQTATFASSASTAITAPPNPPQTSTVVSDTNGKEKQDSSSSTEAPQLSVSSHTPPVAAAAVAPSGPDVPLASPPYSLAKNNTNITILCRYAGKCQNVNCTYKHPPPCRFGMNCMNFNYCSFLHRKPNQFAGNRYKWVAPSLSS